MDETTRRSVIGSDRKITAPNAASAGTVNCTKAARERVMSGSTAYQIA
jgi:hypothetical protein